jgi:hypothetical protein
MDCPHLRLLHPPYVHVLLFLQIVVVRNPRPVRMDKRERQRIAMDAIVIGPVSPAPQGVRVIAPTAHAMQMDGKPTIVAPLVLPTSIR